MNVFGRLAIIAWALGMAWVGLKLVNGQGQVALAALEAGRLSEAIMQFVFVLIVAVGTVAVAGLFLYAGAFRE